MRAIIISSILLASFLASCSSLKGTYGSPNVKQELVNDQMFLVSKYATDSTYGYTQEKPIMVGGVSTGSLNERRFLNALAGPNGEAISYRRLGSCCNFKTPRGIINGAGMLDMYEITYDGLDEPIVLYLNMYDSDVLQVPVGFTLKYDPTKSYDDASTASL